MTVFNNTSYSVPIGSNRFNQTKQRTTMINLKLSKAKAKHLLEILGYMQQNVFDGLWHDEQLTADQLTKTIKSKIKEL